MPLYSYNTDKQQTHNRLDVLRDYMMMMVWVLAIIVALLVAAFIKVKGVSRYRFPPGPKGVPVLGNALEAPIGKYHLYFSELRRQYGDIFTVNIFCKKMVILNSAKVIKEFLASPETSLAFASRPEMFLNKYIDGGKAISSMKYSDVWVKLRKVVHKTLYMYGEGVESTENATRSELEYMVEWISKHEDMDFDIEDVIVPSLINTMVTLILGKRLDYDDPAHKAVMEFITQAGLIVSVSVSSLLMTFPFLRHIPVGYGKMYQNAMKALGRMLCYLYELPKQSYDPLKTRGLLDDFLRTQDEGRMADETFWLDDDIIKLNIKDIITAGSITTRGALMSFILKTNYQPEVVQKIQVEIDDVIGGHRYPSIKDRPHMPYTEATIWELLRYISHAPLSLPHSTLSDVNMGEYFIPENTTVIPNLWEVHHDPELWDKPWEFNPERFLDDDGNMVNVGHENRRNVLAFGAGKRSCPCEVFARSRLFLFICTLLQRFNFRPAEGQKLPSPDPRDFVAGSVLHPDKYRLTASPRNL